MTSHSRLIDAGEVSSERIGRFGDYWRGKCIDGSPPSRAAIHPAEIPRLLPYVVVVEIEREPLRVRYPLVGTRVAEAHGSGYTNLYLDQCDFAAAPLLIECYRRWSRRARRSMPITNGTRAGWSRPRGAVGASQTGFFPLSSDGTAIDGAISIADSDLRRPSRPT